MRPSRSSSTSSVSSASSSPSEDTHHIFVKLLSGETIPLTIPSSTPVAHLQHLLSLRTSVPASSIRLVHAGRHLTASATSNPHSSSSSSSSPSPASESTSNPFTTAPASPLTSPSPSPSPTLSALSIPPNATLHITLPILGGMLPNNNNTENQNTSTTTPSHSNKPKKAKCTFKDCKAASQRIVGDCSFCQGHFCGNHRMLEDHKCTGLEDCKAEAHERNKEVLEGQKTVALRGI